jgi:hypothetical protein
MFNIIITLIGIALSVLSYMGILPIPWWVGLVVAVLPFILSFFGGLVADTRLDDTSGDGVNSCGCPDAVTYYYKPFLGRKKYGTLPCSTFVNAASNKPNRYFQTGCV